MIVITVIAIVIEIGIVRRVITIEATIGGTEIVAATSIRIGEATVVTTAGMTNGIGAAAISTIATIVGKIATVVEIATAVVIARIGEITTGIAITEDHRLQIGRDDPAKINREEGPAREVSLPTSLQLRTYLRHRRNQCRLYQ